MSEAKYKVGDKFIFEIEEVDDSSGTTYYEANGYTFTEEYFSRVKQYDEAKIVREAIQRRIDELMLMVASFEKERDALCDYLNGTGRSGKT